MVVCFFGAGVPEFSGPRGPRVEPSTRPPVPSRSGRGCGCWLWCCLLVVVAAAGVVGVLGVVVANDHLEEPTFCK